MSCENHDFRLEDPLCDDCSQPFEGQGSICVDCLLYLCESCQEDHCCCDEDIV